MASCFCQLADTIWQISCQDDMILAEFCRQYAAFIVPDCAVADCHIFVTPGEVPGPYMADRGIPQFIREQDKIQALHTGSYRGYYSLLVPEAHFTIARAPFCSGKICDVALSICNIIRLMIMIWLPKYRRLLLHSATVIIGGRAYMLLGQSGYGKTTIATLFGSEALTGDVTLAGPDKEGRLCVWPTFLDYLPFKKRLPEIYPLERIYLLSGHRPYSIGDFSSTAAKIKAILENSVGVSWGQAPAMLDLASQLADRVPIQKITYLLQGDGHDQLPRIRQMLLDGCL